MSQPLVSSKAGTLMGSARIPGDKSMSHRALMLGLLCEEETIISGLLRSDDVLNTAQAVRQLGARIEAPGDGLWRVFGTGVGKIAAPAEALDMGNSGTSTRLLMGLVAGNPVTATFAGDPSLSKRPMARVIEPLTQMGAVIKSAGGGRLPLTLTGAAKITPIRYEMPVASAQVKSALLLAGLHGNGETTIVESHPTRDHTENMLRHFGVIVHKENLSGGAQAVSIAGNQALRGCAVDIPADPSSAAFPVVAALLLQGSEIMLQHVGINPRRTGLYDTLQEMGADIRFSNRRMEAGEPVADLIVRGGETLRGVSVPPTRVPSMIDEFPILAIAASCAEGATVMTGLSELRVKESDRLAKIAQGLISCGVDLEEGPDSLIIRGKGRPPRGGAMINAALDHRIAMSFLVLGCVAQEPIAIDDGATIGTSFPGFAALMNGLGAMIGPPS